MAKITIEQDINGIKLVKEEEKKKDTKQTIILLTAFGFMYFLFKVAASHEKGIKDLTKVAINHDREITKLKKVIEEMKSKGE